MERRSTDSFNVPTPKPVPYLRFIFAEVQPSSWALTSSRTPAWRSFGATVCRQLCATFLRSGTSFRAIAIDFPTLRPCCRRRQPSRGEEPPLLGGAFPERARFDRRGVNGDHAAPSRHHGAALTPRTDDNRCRRGSWESSGRPQQM